MTRDDLLVNLERCAAETERGIEAWKTRARQGGYVGLPDDWPLEALLDTNNRPILAGMYTGLGAIYAAIASLGVTE